MTKKNLPSVRLANRQRKVRISLPHLQRQLEKALTLLTPAQLRPLPDTIEITFVGSELMRAVHKHFLNVCTETDVITFHHGEILVCPAVAQKQCRQFKRTVAQEVLLYGIHGILHLSGYKDKTPAHFKRMSTAQEKLLAGVLKKG